MKYRESLKHLTVLLGLLLVPATVTSFKSNASSISSPIASDVIVAKGMDKGGETSGGGQLVRDANNPWFVINTKIVKYCVEFDSQNFSKLTWMPEKLIEKAISYWEDEFAANKPNGQEDTGVASQKFIKEQCQDSTDVRFQFGVLHQNQKQYFKDPTQFVSAAVRTSYDPVTLKGKGFVYISPDSGPLRFQTEKPNQKTWEVGNSGAVYNILKHELGHVFGIPHMGRYPYDLMHERYPEYVAKKVSSNMDTYALDNGYADKPFFGYRPTEELQKVNVSIGTQEFFDLPSDKYDLWISFKKDKIEFYSDYHGHDLIGNLDLDRAHGHSDFLGAIPIYLTSKQKVFSQNAYEMSKADIDYFSSVGMHQVYIPGKYWSVKTGKTRAAFCEYGPYGLYIGGEINGEVINQIIY